MSLLTAFLILLSICIILLSGLLIYRAALFPRQKVPLTLAGESTNVDQILQSVQRINRIDSMARKVAMAAGVLLLAVGAAWFRRVLYGPIILF